MRTQFSWPRRQKVTSLLSPWERLVSHQSSLPGTRLCRDVTHDERRNTQPWMLKRRQTGFLCFNSCYLHVPILRGEMVFMVQFLFKLELNMSVKGARDSGLNFKHFPLYLEAYPQDTSPQDT